MKFVVDSMLGRLAKWLRVLGIDTHYQSVYAPGQLSKLIYQGRTFITRNQKAAALYPGTILIRSDKVKDQLKELKKEGHLPEDFNPFSLCVRCNSYLEQATSEMARPTVPDYVLNSNVGKIKYCPLCRRFYWPGSHRSRMETQLKVWGFLKEAKK